MHQRHDKTVEQIMKKLLLLIPMMFIGALMYAQQSVPNGNFETWNTTPIENPRYFVGTSNRETLRAGLPFNVEKVTDAYHGTYALKLTTVANSKDTMFAFALNSSPDGDPTQWHGGVPYNEKPTGLRGYYKSNIMAGDTGYIIVTFSKNGVNIGAYFFPVYGQQTAYTLLNMNFSPALAQTPDSVIFGAVSSNALVEEGKPGSMLQLDSVSFTGVASQPAQLNGDFELWDIVSAETPASWYTQDGRDLTNIKTTDVYKGAYAVKLISKLNDGDGQMRARGDFVSTGYYPRDCNPCEQIGGYPFTSQNDTLVFWYKYTAVAGTKGEASVKLKKNGTIIGGNNMELDAAAAYQKVEMPLLSGQAPDTLIVEFQSSRWQDSLVSQVGATLFVDEVQLKSNPLNTGISKWTKDLSGMKVYPNPALTWVNVSVPSLATSGTYSLFNMMGQQVLTSALVTTQTTIDIQRLPKGIYTYLIMVDTSAVQTGRLIIE